MRNSLRAGSALALLALLLSTVGCGARAPRPDACRLDVIATERFEEIERGLAVGYRVRGHAGSRGTVWLAARGRGGSYVSGFGSSVGPGPFETSLALELSAAPEALLAFLEVSGRRCRANAPLAHTPRL